MGSGYHGQIKSYKDRTDHGQSLVELALILPILLLFILSSLTADGRLRAISAL